MNRNPLNTNLFRIVFPFLFGMMVYILVLVFFGSATQILDNFFSQEALLCIGITFLLNESLLLLHKIIIKDDLKRRNISIAFLILFSILVSILITTASISLYFKWVLELSNFKRELLIFNLIYVISAILYCIVWIGIGYIQKQNSQIFEKEKLIEKNLQQEFKNLINNTEPKIFFSVLEHILSLLKSNPDLADEYLNKLSSFYRNRLETKDVALIDLKTELETLNLLIDLLNIKYMGKLSIIFKPDSFEAYRIKPFSLVEAIKQIEEQNIINSLNPLLIKLEIEKEKLLLRYRSFPKLEIHNQCNKENTVYFELKQ